MSQETLKSAEIPPVKVAEAVKGKPEEALESSLRNLDKFGGFDLLESSIDAIQNINPERKARKKIFLEESSKKAEREALKKTLQWWSEILNSSDDLADMIQTCQEKSDLADQVLKKNLKAAVENTKGL